MKLTTLILIICLTHASAAVFSQSVTIKKTDSRLEDVLNEIKSQSGYQLFTEHGLVKKAPNVSINVTNVSVDEALKAVMKGLPIEYSIIGSTIVLKKKQLAPNPVSRKDTTRKKTILFIGKVVDEAGQPLPGATVKIKDASLGLTVTNAKGEFSILDASGTGTLQFSFVGYKSLELPAKGLVNPVNIVLHVSNSDLDQVQVLAYSTTSKRLNAGDVTTVTAKEIANQPVQNVLQALQGRVPGLFIQQTTGQAGGSYNLKIRSSTNFSPNSLAPETNTPQPLIIINGVIYPGGTLPFLQNSSNGTPSILRGGNALNFLDPQDIESISVLKDADATAIYGSRGAYGVIVITTKKGKAGPPSLGVNIYTGLQTQGTTPKLLNTQQYLALRRNAMANNNASPGPNDFDVNGTWSTTAYTNWEKVFLGNVAADTHANLNYSGGSDYTNYLISGTYSDKNNIQRGKGNYKDGEIQMQLNTRTADNKLSFSILGSYHTALDNEVPLDYSNSTGVLTAPNAPPLFLPDGGINWLYGNGNPAAGINSIYNQTTNTLYANGVLAYNPVKGLTLRLTMGYTDIEGKELQAVPTTTFAPSTVDAGQQTTSKFKSFEQSALTVNPYAEYQRNVGNKGIFTIIAGAELNKNKKLINQIDGSNFVSDALLNDPASGASVSSSYNKLDFTNFGAFAVIKYVWDNKYILDLNGRRDGSTRFGPDHRWGTFGSVAAAYIFTEEKWMKDNFSFLSFGKLRASTGTVGGDAIADYSYLSSYYLQDNVYQGKPGIQPSSLSNPDLAWEKDRRSEVALDLGFLHDKISVSGSYYYNKASNQLLTTPLSSVTGFTTIPTNTNAVIRTNGWELTLNTNNIGSKTFSWSSGFNITFPESKLLSIGTANATSISPNFVVGKPITGLLAYNYAGVDPKTGTYLFTNAQGVTAEHTFDLNYNTDRTKFIDIGQKFYGGYQNTFRYKKFTVAINVIYTKQKGLNWLAQQNFPAGLTSGNVSTIWLKRWEKPGDVTTVPKVTTSIFSIFDQGNFRQSSGAYTDASYIRLNNASLNYQFTGNVLKALHVRTLEVYLQGENLFTISKYGDVDPENLSAAALPPLRVFTAGINLTL